MKSNYYTIAYILSNSDNKFLYEFDSDSYTYEQAKQKAQFIKRMQEAFDFNAFADFFIVPNEYKEKIKAKRENPIQYYKDLPNPIIENNITYYDIDIMSKQDIEEMEKIKA